MQLLASAVLLLLLLLLALSPETLLEACGSESTASTSCVRTGGGCSCQCLGCWGVLTPKH
jgi:hypothetical protein